MPPSDAQAIATAPVVTETHTADENNDFSPGERLSAAVSNLQASIDPIVKGFSKAKRWWKLLVEAAHQLDEVPDQLLYGMKQHYAVLSELRRNMRKLKLAYNEVSQGYDAVHELWEKELEEDDVETDVDARTAKLKAAYNNFRLSMNAIIEGYTQAKRSWNVLLKGAHELDEIPDKLLWGMNHHQVETNEVRRKLPKLKEAYVETWNAYVAVRQHWNQETEQNGREKERVNKDIEILENDARKEKEGAAELRDEVARLKNELAEEKAKGKGKNGLRLLDLTQSNDGGATTSTATSSLISNFDTPPTEMEEAEREEAERDMKEFEPYWKHWGYERMELE